MGDFDDACWAHDVTRRRVGICGCGNPEALVELVESVLRAAPLSEWWAAGTTYDEDGVYHLTDTSDQDRSEFFEWMQTPPGMFVIDILNHADLLEHGGSAGGSWLTDDGRRFLAVVDRVGVAAVVDPDNLERTADRCFAFWGGHRCDLLEGHLAMHSAHDEVAGWDAGWSDVGQLDLGVVRD